MNIGTQEAVSLSHALVPCPGPPAQTTVWFAVQNITYK